MEDSISPSDFESFFVDNGSFTSNKNVKVLYKELKMIDSNYNASGNVELNAAPDTLNILLVDDTPYNIYILKELLLQIDPTINITEAHHGQIAINKIVAVQS